MEKKDGVDHQKLRVQVWKTTLYVAAVNRRSESTRSVACRGENTQTRYSIDQYWKRWEEILGVLIFTNLTHPGQICSPVKKGAFAFKKSRIIRWLLKYENHSPGWIYSPGRKRLHFAIETNRKQVVVDINFLKCLFVCSSGFWYPR